MKRILPWKYPTTTIILDDSRSFLYSMELVIPKKNRRLLFVTKPSDAIRLIKQSNDRVQQAMNNLCIDQNDFDFDKIPRIAKCPHRSFEISSIVIDYHMPSMNGIEVCEQLKENSCQKILLTANSDEGIAIEAFNQGLIQKYLQKQNPRIDELLCDLIAHAEDNYFISKFSAIMPEAEQSKLLFRKPELQSFIKGYLIQNEVVEHYLTDGNGSLFCMHQSGTASQLFIKNEEEIKIPLTWRVAEDLPQSLIQEISFCKKMLCLSIGSSPKNNSDLWQKYLLKANPIPNALGYFFAISNDPIYTSTSTDITSAFIDDERMFNE